MNQLKPELKDGMIMLEPPELNGHLGLWLKLDRVLLHKQTDYQELAVVECGPLGRVLLLDRIIQLSEYDEAAYHEMMVHVPLLSHPNPSRVLIIGGGDGGTLRETLKHPQVEKVVLCEIDAEVIQASRRFFPVMAPAFDDPRVEIQVADGRDFITGTSHDYDLIMVDSSDPDPQSPARVLYTEEFYQNVKTALKPGGMVVSQFESYYLYGELLKKLYSFLPSIFPRTHYYVTSIASYLSGVMGFGLCSLGPDPMQLPDQAKVDALGNLQYYTPKVHQAAFALPAVAQQFFPQEVLKAQGL